MEINTSKCTTEYELSHDEYTHIPSDALWRIFPIRNKSILVYSQHVSFLLAGVLSTEIVMLSFPTNQEEATPLKMYVFYETSLFELNLIQ